MLQRLRSRLNREEGFTLIELLVVILIIGILAAIAIPSFLNQRGKGEDADAKSGARTAQTAIESAMTDRGNYDIGDDDAGVTVLRTLESQVPEWGTDPGEITDLTTDTTSWSVTVDSGNRTFTIARAANGAVTQTCTVTSRDDAGGCRLPASGTSGTW
ncbi:MAG TPA: prepilin-type N-terminal cleavage/methylation domain-containing protein [Capillimicrobium sp.]